MTPRRMTQNNEILALLFKAVRMSQLSNGISLNTREEAITGLWARFPAKLLHRMKLASAYVVKILRLFQERGAVV